MSEPKTQRTKASVSAFIAAVEDDTRRKDARAVDKMMREISGEKPAMWGPSIIGYGEWQTPSGKWPRIGFSPRKANLVLYVMDGYEREPLMKKLGKHKTGRSCLYINKLADVDEGVLREIVAKGWKIMAKKYPE
ncbi:MAG: DUF1801 domain-containing protein [Hyphomonadaceae bacterium]